VNITRLVQPRRLRPITAAVIAAIAGLVIPLSQIASAGASEAAAVGDGPKPTIVLVHGAWADTSSWDGVIQRLQADGYTVYAPPNPLQGLAYDPAYLADFLPTSLAWGGRSTMVVSLIMRSCRPRSFANQTGPRRSARQGGPTYLARDSHLGSRFIIRPHLQCLHWVAWVGRSGP
jgi:hypothetical protein